MFCAPLSTCAKPSETNPDRSILEELGREGADLSERMEGFQILINSSKCGYVD
jgi:hypothetical protein